MNHENKSTRTLLEICDVSISFGGLMALTHVSSKLEEGQIFSLIGPNGAGKTTALNVITQLYKPNAGEVIFRGNNLLGMRADQIIGAGISRTFQNVGLFSGLTTLENIMSGLHAFGKAGFFSCALNLKRAKDDEAWRAAKAKEMLKLVNLDNQTGIGEAMATDLPYGQQKLVGLARALISDPVLLILDEPASGLSPIEVDQLADLVRTLRDERGITILLVEHDMNFVMGISDHIAVLNFGQKIAEGTPEEIRKNAQVIDAYLGEEEVE